MNRKITAFCVAVVMLCSLIAVAGSKTAHNGDVKNVSTAVVEPNYNGAQVRDEAADMNEDETVATTASGSTTSSGVNLGDLTGLLGGSGDGLLSGGGLGDLGDFGSFGDIIGDAGDVIGSVFGNDSSKETNTVTVVVNTPVTQYPNYSSNYLEPVPAATYVQSQTSTEVSTDAAAQSTESDTSVDAGETSNPYKKPAGDIKVGDTGDGVKWVQWVLQFTGYGLQGKTIDGIYDEATEALVKKFQKEQGLTDDGVINSATVDKLELMYYKHAMTLTTVASTESTTYPQITDSQADENDKGVSTAVIIAIIAAVWCVAIGVVVAILVIKKKKDKEAEASTSKPSGGSNGDMNLSDLFEEANNKKK